MPDTLTPTAFRVGSPSPPTKKWLKKMLAELIEKTERGITDDPFAAALKKPVDEHLDEFEQHLISKNITPEHVTQTINQIRVYLEEAEPRTIA